MFFKLKIAQDWTRSNPVPDDRDLVLNSKLGHELSVQLVDDGIVRVVYRLPEDKARNSHKIEWETKSGQSNVEVKSDHDVLLSTKSLNVSVGWEVVPRIQVSRKGDPSPFHIDLDQRGYSFDALTGTVTHFVEREAYTSVKEEEDSPYDKTPSEMQDILSFKTRSEFVYGVGESRGPIVKGGRKFTLEARDAMGYSVDEGDPLYKIHPFYLVFNRDKNLWYGVWYNTLADSELDLGSECDVVWGNFRRFTTKANPLDYYIIYADGTLPSVIHQYAKLCTPHSSKGFSTSEALPPLGQFGYLGSTMEMAEQKNAPELIVEYIKECRENGFPMDGFHLSSGWCRTVTGERQYFRWNLDRFPDPAAFCHEIEENLKVPLIVNIKPWLLESHEYYKQADEDHAFVRAAEDEYSQRSANGSGQTLLWSGKEGEKGNGSYFDFSSKAADRTWKLCIHNDLFKYGVTGLWIDNNEFSSLFDDDEGYKGEIPLFNVRNQKVSAVQKRMGWSGAQRVGAVGRGVQTMGMARSSFYAYKDYYPDKRPFIVSRSGVVGIQAFAHSSWSGDNHTSWRTLKGSTKITLSLGLSVGPGLYGHDIGGFACDYNPSAELLVRWVQQSALHTRFTVHSNKPVPTSLWMYDEVTPIIRDMIKFRYQMTPTMYSFYVTHYFRQGWPVLKPVMWYHSIDNTSLVVDEQYIFGESLLVAPVTDKGKTEVTVFFPSRINGHEEDLISWCDISNGNWYHPQKGGELITIDAPLDKLPIFARSGAIYVMGGDCSDTIYESQGVRTIHIFANPKKKSSGQFTLIEDDGRTNEHTDKGIYTEISILFEADAERIQVSLTPIKQQYKLPYSDVEIVLPAGDKRLITVLDRNPTATARGVKVAVL